MLLDFNVTAHKAFTTVYERTLEGGLPDALKDKPLQYVSIDFKQQFLEVDGVRDTEELQVGILSEYQAEALPDNFSYMRQPKEVLERYVAASRSVARVALDNSLVIADAMPVEAIDATYVLTYAHGRSRHVSSYKDKPAKASIAAGMYFAEEAVAYAETDNVYLPLEVRLKNKLFEVAMLGGESELKFIGHRITLEYVPDLPLNGYESKAFLQRYADDMLRRSLQSSERIMRYEAITGHDYLLDQERAFFEKHYNAYCRAQAILDSRS
jgi:hypothetical protein